MNPKTILTEKGWDDVAPDCKGKDKELRKTLSFCSSLKDEDFDSRCKALIKIAGLAGTLKAANEVKGDRDAVKHLTDVINAAKLKQGELTKAKAEAEKGKALAAKAAAATQKKADADAKAQEKEAEEGDETEEEEEDEDETGDYRENLKAAYKKLKGSKELVYNFIVCDIKPQCGLIISKQRIGAKHKAELTKVTGGKRFLKPGTCHVDSGKLVFDMEKAPQGLAAKLKKSIKYFTGLNIKVVVGDQSDEDEEGQPEAEQPEAAEQKQKPAAGGAAGAAASNTPAKGPLSLGASVGRGGKNNPEDVTAVQTALNTRAKAGLPVNGKCDPATIKAIEEFQKLLGQPKPNGLIEPDRGTARALASTAKLGPPPAPPQPIAPPKLGKAALSKAPEIWRGTRAILDTNIKELKKGIRAHYGTEHPDFLKALDENLVKLDVVLDKLDDRLSDSLAKAGAAKDEAARKAELKNSKTILVDYLKYVKSEPIIAHIDANPFGVKTNLKKVLTDSLTNMAQSIG